MLTKLKVALALCAGLAGIGGIAGGIAAADNPGSQEIRGKLLEKYDTNGDGKLDAQERAVMRADFKAKREARKAEILAKYDLNKDGKLEPSERKLMIDDRAAKVFAKMDSNGDGQVSLAEFQAFKESHPMMRHARWGKRGGFHRSVTGGAASTKAE
ncbi:MAG TPA: hypothetical protein VMJ10_15395 [Kofleriaceae bacterium]|nr:hypothetical protein [Kofleriaceae bacterium]